MHFKDGAQGFPDGFDAGYGKEDSRVAPRFLAYSFGRTEL
jgi:hypothetical protein